MATYKCRWYLEYRQDGRWFPIMSFTSKQAAEDYAKQSYSCKQGYQIKKGRGPK